MVRNREPHHAGQEFRDKMPYYFSFCREKSIVLIKQNQPKLEIRQQIWKEQTPFAQQATHYLACCMCTYTRLRATVSETQEKYTKMSHKHEAFFTSKMSQQPRQKRRAYSALPDHGVRCQPLQKNVLADSKENSYCTQAQAPTATPTNVTNNQRNISIGGVTYVAFIRRNFVSTTRSIITLQTPKASHA